MNAYGPLAVWYDGFTQDVPYDAFADYYEDLLRRESNGPMTLLDLCCGTGTLTLRMAERGHELIGVDVSPEMLSQAQAKAAAAKLSFPPLFLCQEASELDLYGTVQGAYCSLDGMNYLPPENLPKLLRRMHLFLEPGGVFAFDIHAPQHLRELDGCVFADETEDALCLWRGEFDAEENALFYAMDIFSRGPSGLWRRDPEEHIEYAHDPEQLCALLQAAGFTDTAILRDGPQHEMGRLFLRAVNLPH